MKKIPFIFGLIFVSLLIIPSLSSADSIKYFYDDLGRLTRVVKGTVGTIYNYDELGNLVSVTSATTSTSSPILTSISPNVLFVGSKLLVTITGQNLLTTESVVSIGGFISIGNIQVTDTQVTAEVTALSAGTDAIKVTTQNGPPNYATIGVTLSSSKLTFSPGQLAIATGSNGTVTAGISPPLSNPLTVNLSSGAPSVATVPLSVTIPVSGTTTFTVNAIREGVATVRSGDINTVVFVTSPFSGDVSRLSAKSISVYIDAPPGTSPVSALPVSVHVDAPQGSSPATALPVSVYVNAPSGSSMALTNPVSVYIDVPPGESLVIAGGVSVKIQ